MYRFENILVNLSLTDTDIPLLRLAGLLTKLACSKSVTFVYAREPVEIPEQLKAEYPWLVEPIQKSARARADFFIAAYFDGYEETGTKVELDDRQPALTLLQKSLEGNIDLILTGDFDLDRSLAVKLARKAPCSVMLVPARSSGNFSRIGLALDLSKYSEYVLEIAVAFASAHECETVDCVNFYAIPEGFHKTNRPSIPFQDELKAFSEEKLSRFLESHNLKGVAVHPLSYNSPVPGTTLLSLAEKENYDLLIVGCRGKNALTATLLGSNAEDVLRGSREACVLAVKEKGTGRSFLESLLKLNTATA